jgi:hypothetical protein
MSDFDKPNSGNADMDRSLLDEWGQHESWLKAHFPRQRPEVEPKKLPKGSLYHLAKALGISQRHARRLCEERHVAGAYRPKGKKHWRVDLTPQNVEQTRRNLKPAGKTRKRGGVGCSKLLRDADD